MPSKIRLKISHKTLTSKDKFKALKQRGKQIADGTRTMHRQYGKVFQKLADDEGRVPPPKKRRK